MDFQRMLRLIGAAVALTAVAAASTCQEYAPNAEHDSLYMICPPANQTPLGLVVFAHGYVAPGPDLTIPDDQLHIQGEYIPDIVNGMGLAFAATSFPKNGLAIKEGISDVAKLVAFYYTETGFPPAPVYIVGVSEGGLVAAKAIEQPGTVFNGGLALCGPVGDFRAQLNWFDDFRVIFDYFFPDGIPGTAIEIPPQVISNWNLYAAQIGQAVASHPSAASQLFSVTKVLSPPDQLAATAVGLLWYNVFGTDDTRTELGGQPFGNRLKWYFGSLNDWRLNREVERYTADPAALLEIQRYYQTTGRLQAPLVTMHTTGDPIIPFWHEPLYLAKVLAARQIGRYVTLPAPRYGHCTFQAAEVLFGFSLLARKVTGLPLAGAETALHTEAAREQYRSLVRTAGR